MRFVPAFVALVRISAKLIAGTRGILAAHSLTVAALERALETAGVEFTNGDQPGVRLRKISAKSDDQS